MSECQKKEEQDREAAVGMGNPESGEEERRACCME